MDVHVKTLYEHGDTGALIAIATRTDDRADVNDEARRALRLLARLGDPAAGAFCAGAARGDQNSSAA